MKNNTKRVLMSSVAAASLIAGSAAPALAAADQSDVAHAPADSIASENVGAAGAGIVKKDVVEGNFSYVQTETTPNSVIAKLFRSAVATWCGATVDFVEDYPLEWKLAVSGDVENAFVADVGDLAGEESVQQVMTCNCGGNPSDGASIITADVKGIPISHLIAKSDPVAGANTITFVASDGMEVSMPLAYVIGRHAVISYEINDEDLSASVGGNNQLWMTSTPANYFVRDIVEVVITKEATPPANPGEGGEHPNSPNAGFLSAEA